MLLGNGGAFQVENEEHRTVWVSGIAAPGARLAVITDDGDVELLSGEGITLLNSRTGPVQAAPMPEAAAAADISRERYLVREGKQRRLVTRNRDGSLRVSHDGVTTTLVAPLARWLEQDGTQLTWRMLPDGDRKAWTLCLVNADGDLIWREGMRNLPTVLPPAQPHPYGGPELGRGARLRHQSLTSLSGAYTLVHQDDGDLVLYHNATHRAVWATNTWWAGDGWAELTEEGDLVVRNLCGAPVWRSGTAGSGAERLVVDNDGGFALLDASDAVVWRIDTGGHRSAPEATPARGSALYRGQRLQRQSLTSPDGSTVLAHRDDRRLVLFGEDGRWLWDAYIHHAERSYVVLDEDGVLRVRAEDGTVALDLGGPADELVVVEGQAQLRTSDGRVVWRNGEQTAAPETGAPPAADFTSWMDALMDDTAYCVTVIHHIDPDEALRRLGAQPERVTTGTWGDLLELAEREEAYDFEDIVVAAFALGPHTLLVEDNRCEGIDCPELSAGTFAVSCYMNINADSAFVVYRDGETVADHSRDSGSREPTTPEVCQALTAMGAPDVIKAAFLHDLELLCRTAGVQPTVADVTGPARIAVVTDR
ncbi:Curculin domain-containing protein (mannose-binding) lectin [Streptomyces sp. NA02950]|uniref:DUF6461 domain-containing protein n=1 Tax=Streptomyces sp. NA02950 TaxID=2742137 RepID=UPI0015916C9B|nr:DUF6461 domain-containing protein [Streptomyces sp. NA02950]QKV96017.1 Curculin domain-containing protein (mannose-binding) lectin [Streptomyces sp. NA02950]